jgi:hypothetical protein
MLGRGVPARIGRATYRPGGPVTRVIRVTEVLAALSLTTDLATGMDFEKGLRTCVVATALARHRCADERMVRAVFETALLRSVGCTSYAPELAELFEDDVAFQAAMKRLDFGDDAVFARQLDAFGTWSPTRSAELARTFVDVLPTVGVQAMRTGCEASHALGAEFGLLPESLGAIDDVYERWDGRGIPDGRAGIEVSPVARIVHVAEQVGPTATVTTAGTPPRRCRCRPASSARRTCWRR